MKQVVFIADDFGLDEAINDAIVRAHEQGALSGASLMMGQPWTDHAVSLARAHPTLRVGWHLHLCDSQPTTCPSWPWGGAPLRAGLSLGMTAGHRALVEREISMQWRLFQATGLRCHFVNAHHHLHVHPAVLGCLDRRLPATFEGWIRGFNVRLFGSPRTFHAVLARMASPAARRFLSRSRFRTSSTLWGLDRLHAMRADEIIRAIARLPSGLHEFVLHPRVGQGSGTDLDALLDLRSAGHCGGGEVLPPSPSPA